MPVPRRATVRSVNIPAPMGGINTVDAGAAMPPEDCIYLFNMIASEYGLRSRLGYREWCTNLTGALDSSVRSVLAFTGSAKSGANDKLFACTETGIWDVTSSSSSPTQLVTFPIQVGDVGYGVACVMATAAGRFLLYCDEANGLYVWSETAGSWSKISVGTRQAWAANTAYIIGNQVVNGGNVYVCDQNGTSAGSGGPTTTGTNIVDNSTRWDYVGSVSTTAIGPSLADQNLGYTADPTNFVFATVWKNRVWFVERDTSRGWYLDINSIYGVATSFDFGPKMRAGGPLVGLYNWSYDGGGGLDTLLVGISGAGDVVIYQGTDPSSISTFGLKGCWSLGAVPYGRRIATDHGGDLLAASAIGIIPLSKLVVSGRTEDQSLYATGKISNLFNQLATSRRARQGWALHIHPSDNTLLVTIPGENVGGNTEQLVMSLGRKSWGRYRDLPILSGATWAGEFWFGTADGRVCRNIDYVDNVLLSDPNSYSAVEWSVLTAFNNLGNAKQKQVKLIRPSVLSGVAAPTPGALVAWVQATARYNYNLIEPTAPVAQHSSSGWNFDLWDNATFGADYSASQPLTGAAGMGREVAIAVRGTAVSRTILAGIDVLFELGGEL